MLFNGNLRIEKVQGGGTYVRTDGRTDGHKEINPCVLQDIGPLGPLPKKLKKRIKCRTARQWKRKIRMKCS